MTKTTSADRMRALRERRAVRRGEARGRLDWTGAPDGELLDALADYYRHLNPVDFADVVGELTRRMEARRAERNAKQGAARPSQ